MNNRGVGSKQNSQVASKGYNTIVEFAKFLRENGDKLFEKDAKLCLKTDQLFILQEYLQQIQPNISNTVSSISNNENDKFAKQRKSQSSSNSNLQNNKEFLILYKSNQLHLIQDFLFKITNLKIASETQFNTIKDYVKLNIFGSLTYLEIKNCPMSNVLDLQNLRNQLEVLICVKSINKLQDLLQLCGADQSSPLNWPKLHTLNLSHNQLTALDNSFRLTTSIEILDLSHNNLKDCGIFLHNLTKLKKLNVSFNKLEAIPNLCASNNISTCEYIDLSFNSIETIDTQTIAKLASVKYINLAHNLIGDLVQINHLRLLTNVNQIIVQQNPVTLNLKCELILREILAVVVLKNSMKNTNKNHANLNWNSVNFSNNRTIVGGKSQLASAPRININRNIASQQQKLNSTMPQILSVPNNLSDSFFTIPKKIKKPANISINQRKLKAHNVLIEQDDSLADDYYIVNPDNREYSKSTKNESYLDANNLLSTSVGDYDSSKLQTELENLKKMRQSYGTDWLLSTPSLLEINKQLLNEKISSANSENKKRSLTLLNKDTDAAKVTKSSSSSLTKLTLNVNKQLEDKEIQILESFAVYRSVQSKFSTNNTNINFELDFDVRSSSSKASHSDDGHANQGVSLCILSLSEKFLIEKDEINTNVLSINEYINLESIDVMLVASNEQELNQIKIKSKDSEFFKIYQFENINEINSFIECMKSILFNEVNIDKCEIYYCTHCSEFGKKSKLKLDDIDLSNNNNSANDSDSLSSSNNNTKSMEARNLTCTKCNSYLIKDNKIQFAIKQFSSTPTDQSLIETQQLHKIESSKSLLSAHKRQSVVSVSSMPLGSNSNFTLKEVLNSFKTQNDELNDSNASSGATNETGDKKQNQINEVDEREQEDVTSQGSNGNKLAQLDLSDNLDEKLKSILNNTQINKHQLDDINLEAKRINNNLKLYLIINILNNQENQSLKKEETEDESIVCTFVLKHLTFYNGLSTSQDVVYDKNSLCVLTNKNVILFKIINEELFMNNCEFEKCLKKEHIFSVSQIEYIDIGLGQHYFQLEVIVDGSEKNNKIKFVTFDVYQTQAYINNLLKIINESKHVPMLKQIRKNSETTNKNLEAVLRNTDVENLNSLNLTLSQINMFTFVSEFKLNNQDNLANSKFEQTCFELFFYNNERLLIVEENLCYFHKLPSNSTQFNLIAFARISDIVQLKLFKENDNQIEISFVDELRNSKQFNWSFCLNKQFLLSQLITQLKDTWEKIFFIELPINF